MLDFLEIHMNINIYKFISFEHIINCLFSQCLFGCLFLSLSLSPFLKKSQPSEKVKLMLRIIYQWRIYQLIGPTCMCVFHSLFYSCVFEKNFNLKNQIIKIKKTSRKIEMLLTTKCSINSFY